MLLKVTTAEERMASPAALWFIFSFPLLLCCLTRPSHCPSPLCAPSSPTYKSVKMDMSKLPKLRDEERESEFGYVHGVSGPGRLPHIHTHKRYHYDHTLTFSLIVHFVLSL